MPEDNQPTLLSEDNPATPQDGAAESEPSNTSENTSPVDTRSGGGAQNTASEDDIASGPQDEPSEWPKDLAPDDPTEDLDKEPQAAAAEEGGLEAKGPDTLEGGVAPQSSYIVTVSSVQGITAGSANALNTGSGKDLPEGEEAVEVEVKK